MFNIPPVLQVADRQIHDAENHGDETLSVAQILKVSSNIGADEIGMKLGAKRFDYWVHRFGFGSPTGVDLPGEEQGIVLRWLAVLGVLDGQPADGPGRVGDADPDGDRVLGDRQRRRAAPAAHRQVDRRQGEPRSRPATGSSPRPRRLRCATCFAACSPTAAPRRAPAIPGYDMAGKTGTANVVVGGNYSSTEYVASFIGFVPTNNPKLLVAVMVDRPQGAIYGGSVAAPAFQKIVGWAVPYLGISPR